MFGLGGVLANLLLMPATLLVAAWWPFQYGTFFWLLTAGFNLILAMTNLVPFRVRIGRGVLMSDGALVLYALRAGRFPSAPVNTIALVQTLRGLLCDLGNRLAHTVYLLAAANAWRALGCVARAEALCAEAAADAQITPEVAALFALAQAGVAAAAHRLDEAGESLDGAERIFKTRQIDAGLLFTTFGRAEICLHRGDALAAAVLVESLGDHALLRERPAFRADWLSACIQAQAAAGDDAALARLRTEHETLRRALPSVERDLLVYGALAVRAAVRGDATTAEADFRKALAAAKDVHDRLPADADRADFLACQQAPLLEPARACLRQLGKAAEADRIDASFQVQAAVDDMEVAEQLRRSRRNNRWFLIAGLDLGALEALAAVVLLMRTFAAREAAGADAAVDPLAEFEAICALLLLVGALVTVPVAAVWYVAGLLRPSLHNRAGWIVSLPALTPLVLACVVALSLLAG